MILLCCAQENSQLPQNRNCVRWKDKHHLQVAFSDQIKRSSSEINSMLLISREDGKCLSELFLFTRAQMPITKAAIPLYLGEPLSPNTLSHFVESALLQRMDPWQLLHGILLKPVVDAGVSEIRGFMSQFQKELLQTARNLQVKVVRL